MTTEPIPQAILYLVTFLPVAQPVGISAPQQEIYETRELAQDRATALCFEGCREVRLWQLLSKASQATSVMWEEAK